MGSTRSWRPRHGTLGDVGSEGLPNRVRVKFDDGSGYLTRRGRLLRSSSVLSSTSYPPDPPVGPLRSSPTTLPSSPDLVDPRNKSRSPGSSSLLSTNRTPERTTKEREGPVLLLHRRRSAHVLRGPGGGSTALRPRSSGSIPPLPWSELGRF